MRFNQIMDKDTKALDGIRVLDFTHMLAGPLGTHHLRLMGAEVIKVEPPRKGDPMRWGANSDVASDRAAPVFAAVNAGKKSIAVDLKAPGGRELITKLAQDVDVVVENFRPGVMAKLGLGHEELLKANPKLIYCSVSGYGQKGPMRYWPAYDHVVQAVTGMATLSGDDAARPMRVGFPVIDAATGMAVASAVIGALLKLTRSGKGQYIDLCMLEVAATLMFPMLTECMATGEIPMPRGNRGFTGSPGSDTFQTREGWIAIGANTPVQFEALCRLIGLPNLMEDPALIQGGDASRSFVQAADAAAVRRHIQEALLSHTAAHWEFELNAAHVPAARLRNLAEFGGELPLNVPSAIVQLPPMSGYPHGIKTLNVAFSPQHEEPGASAICPRLGEDTAEVLARAGFQDNEISALQREQVIT